MAQKTKMSTKMSIDIETRSDIDLTKVGVAVYSQHESTVILCISFKLNNEKTYVIKPRDKREYLTHDDFNKMIPLNDHFLQKLQDPEVELHAFNESFERLLFRHCGFRTCGIPDVHYTRWHCTMVRALYFNLPASLKTCAKALGLDQQKDMSGSRNMLDLCKPRQKNWVTEAKPEKYYTRERPEWEEKYQNLYEYCRQDVEVEAAISDYLAPLPMHEQNLFNLDKRMNGNGVYIDVEAIKAAQKVEKIYKVDLVKKFKERTGLKPTQGVKVREYFNNKYSAGLKDMKATTIEKLMRKPLNPEFEKDLIIRNEAAKTSLSKLKKYIMCMTSDKKIHGAIQFYGASATGRFAGRLFQPQNLPSRNIYKNIDQLFRDLKTFSPEDFIEIYREEGVIKVLSSCLRGFIIPPPGEDLFQFDYSAIEGRVIAWLGGVENDLKTFRAGLCVYREFAKVVFGLSHEEAHALDKGSIQRAICKEGVLKLGYCVGHESYGNKLYEDTKEMIDVRCKCKKDTEYGRIHHTCEAHRVVTLYRSSRPGVTELWDKMGRAAIAAISTPDKVFKAGIFKFIKKDIFLIMRLPNGRTLKYPGAAVEYVDKWGNGNMSPQVHYFGHRKDKKSTEEIKDPDFTVNWRKKRMYGGKFFQNAAQAIARDIMCEAMERLEDTGTYKLSLTVHDEIVGTFKKGDGSVEEIEKLMIISPDWAKDIPLAVSGGIVERFCK